MPKRKTPEMEEFTLCECVAISGGGLRSPVVLDIVALAEVKYVKVGKSLDWLCQATTGVHYSRWPVKRCQVFSLIGDALVKSSSVPPQKNKVVDPMAELRGTTSAGVDALQKLILKDKLISEICLLSSFGGSDNVAFLSTRLQRLKRHTWRLTACRAFWLTSLLRWMQAACLT